MWVRFLRAFDFDPPRYGGRVTLAFTAGQEVRVPRACASAALAARAAVEITPPRSQTAESKDNAPFAE